MISEGSLYRLASFEEGDLASYQYISRDQQEIVVFAFQQAQYFGSGVTRICLQGLQPDAVYAVAGGAGTADTPWHGSNLMNIGLPLTLRGDYASQLIQLKRQA
ncbi:hypothetical protein D3C75_1067130 [compost metagenome]